MEKINLSKFVDLYSKYYYKDTWKKLNATEKAEIGKWNISISQPAEQDFEKHIVKQLGEGKYDIYSVAWKLGIKKADVGDNNSKIIKTQYYTFSKKLLSDYCSAASEIYKQNSEPSTFFEKINQDNIAPQGIGTVQLINALFFLSKGKIPIYDYYAHVAVKALLLDMNPQEVFVGEAPSKSAYSKGRTKHLLACNLLNEYTMLLNQLNDNSCDSEEYYDKDGMLITRDLDRALWVYGHCSQKWNQGG